MTSLRFVFCLLISIPAYTYAAAENAGGSVSAGQEKSAVCQGCHGTDGNSFGPEWPNLASQNATYLSKQIHDFQSGARKDETMSSMVTGLAESDIADIAAYFSSQKVKAEPATGSTAAGKKVYLGGNRYTRLPACSGCHGPNGAGNGPGIIPQLAGQKAAYTAKTLRDFKSGTRSNDRNNIMRDIAGMMSDAEIDAVASYLSGLGAVEAEPAKP